MAAKSEKTGENTGEKLVAWQKYTASGPEELNLEEGDVVELIDTEDPSKSPFKRIKLDPELEKLENTATLLDSSAAKHKLSVRPPRKHASSRYSPTRNVLNARWLVRQTKGDKKQGWVPCRILQSVDDPIPGSGLPGDATFRRQAVVKELVETEQEFVKDLEYVVQQYLIRTENTKVPKIIKDNLDLVFGGLVEIANFHRTVLMEGVKYYANEPNLLGKAFLRLERDFDKHVHYCSEEPLAQSFLEGCDIAREYYDEISQGLSDDKTLSEHLKLPIQRINDYQLLLKELVRYSECLGEDSTNLQKALELMLSVPHRAQDDKFINSIEGYRGSIHKLGRLLYHDWFTVTFGTTSKERYLFLFKARILISKVRRISEDRSVFQLKDIIRLPQVEIKDRPDTNNFELVDKVGGQSIILTAHREHVKEVWLKEIREFTTDVEEIAEDLQIISETSAAASESLHQAKPFVPQKEEKNSVLIKEKQFPEHKRETILDEPKPAKVPKLIEAELEPVKNFVEVSNIKEIINLELSESSQEVKKQNWANLIVEQIDQNVKTAETEVAVEETQDSNMSRKYSSLSSGKGVDSGTDESTAIPIKKLSDTVDTSNSVATTFKLTRDSSTASVASDGKPVFTRNLSGVNVEPGETAVFEVALASAPDNVIWLKDNKPVKECVDIKAKKLEENVFHLEIKKAQTNDAGLYSAVATNSFGKTTCSAQLIVHELTDEERAVRLESDKPIFLIQLKDTELLEDTYLRFMVKVKGDPSPQVTFYKDDVKIRDSDKRCHVNKEAAEKGFYELIIPDVKPQDAGTYKCIASNKFGEIFSEATVTVTESKQLFEGLLEEPLLVPGEKPVFTWKKDGISFEPEERFKVLLGDDEDSLALVFQHVRPEDAGLYTCVAQTSSGHISCSAELTVHGLLNQLPKEPIKPTLVVEKRETLAAVGSSAMLELQVKGYPKPQVKWTHEGKPIEPSGKYKFLYEDEESMSLVIKDVQAEDAGKYVATAQNELGGDTAEVTLNVKAPPKIKTKLDNISAEAELTIQVPVEVEGIPNPTVQFFKDGQEIRKTEHIKIVDDGSKHTLIIEESHIKDSGSYSVVASNEVSQVSKFFEMDIYSKPKLIKRMGKEKTVTKGEDIKLIAQIESRPEAEVKWYKNEEEIISGGKYLIKKDGDLYILKITGSVSTDASNYKIKAKNIHGTVDDDCMVYVKRPPIITKPLEDMTVTEHDVNVTLDIKHDAYPKPAVKWYLDETEISEFRKEFTRIESDDGTKLIINEVNSELSGQYKCKLINELGETETSAKLTVNCKPRFIKHLKDVTIDEGATLHLEVEVDAYPKPTVKWLRNGREVSTDARIKITRDSHRYETFHLAVDLIKYEEQGEYEVVVTNTLGTVSSKSIVTVQIPPRLLDSNMKDKTQYESLELCYVVQAEASPTPTPMWSINGKPLTADSHYNISDDGKKFKLEIKKLDMKDAGTVECKLINPLGEIKQKAVLSVTPEMELRKPKIIVGMEDQTIVKGKPAKLSAVVTADPLPDVSWCINGKEITPEQYENSSITLNAEDHDIEDGLKECTYSLAIPRCDQVNTGKYTIKAKNKWSEAESSAQLTIILRPEIDGPEDLSIVPGNVAEFNVIIRANPEPEVKWFKDGTVLTNTDTISIVEDAPNETYKLIIKSVQLSDDGKYKVTAMNDLGEAISEARLRAVTEKPHFVTGLTNCEVEENGEVVLKVRADGLPTPEIHWFFNGKPLHEDATHKIDHKSDTHRAQSTIVITCYSPADIGQYKAMAVNIVGEAETTATISMLQILPSFTKQFDRSEELNEGEPLELKAKISGSPIPTAIWCKDGEPIPQENNRVQTTLLPDGTAKLNIEKVVSNDSGAYKLLIKNPKGEASALCAVAVNPKPHRPKFVKCFKDLKVVDGDTIRLEAVVSAFPPPEIKWQKDGALVRPSSNVHLEHHPDGKVALVVDCAKPENAGTYTLTASNKLGEGENDAKVKVDKKPAIPEFVAELQPLTVVEGFPAIFEVKTKGFPPPKVTWTRNGVEIIPDNKHITINELPDGTNALVIDACDALRDPMLYKAVATNEAGKVESVARLSVTPSTKEGEPEEAPVLLQSLKDIAADEGQPIVIELPFTANPIPHVQWFKDGIPLPSSGRAVLTCDGKKIGLHISEATPSDSGHYGVTLSNALGADDSEGIISVHKIFSPPRFTQKFTDLQQVIGRDAKFIGKVSGIPTPEVTWYKDGVKLENTDKYHIKKEGDVCTLIVKDCDSFDNGLYRAFAVNREGSDTCQADLEVVDKIDVTQKAEPPSFLKKIGDLELYPGMTAKFTACASGYPEPQVEWFKDNQKLHPSNRITMEVDRAGLLRLIITGIHEEDLGKYSCKITNDHGSDICHADLRFDDLDTQSKRPLADEYIDYDKHQKSGIPVPLADAPIISRMTDRHCTLSWKPSMASYPRTPVTYQLEMCEMPHGDWFVARSGIRSCVCGVGNLEPFRDYRFRVRVENKYGISDPSPYATTYREKLEPPITKPRSYLPPGTDFHLDRSCYFPKDFDIERPLHDNMAHPPQFLRQEHPTQYGIRDQNTNLFWYVYGYPKPKMQYFFNDELVESGGRFDMSYTRNGQATLFINKMLDRDVGWYDAVATNEHGQARQRVRLEIAEPPEFISRLDIQYAMPRGKVRFEARIIGKPYPEIKWYKDWKPLAESSRIKIRFLEPDHAIITIDDVISADAGLYSVSARNVAGTVSSSAMLYIDDNSFDYKLHTFEPISQIKTKRKLFDDFYDLGDELGRGTQGITYHAVERKTGNSYAAKVMHGRGDVRHFMYNELDMYNHLRHRRLISLYDAYETSDGLQLVLELGGGGELFKDYLMKRDYYTEYEIAGFIKQLLEGIQYMHERSYAHMGLNIGDLLLSHSGGTDLKITDFGLTRRITPGSLYPLLYGVPEYVSPEAASGEPTGFAHDMWSIGIITYILLSGRSPFLGKDDRETLTKIKYGSWTFSESCWNRISVEARDFITKLLVYQPESRMDVHAALRHPWLERIERTVTDEYRISSSTLRDYFLRYREWYDNASCRRWFRRRPLEGAFTHPSRMVYPPGEVYTPPSSPPPARRLLAPITNTWEDQLPSRSPLNYEIGLIKSESHYQNGPDTYLLQLRDVGFPVRIREYMKIAANRGPGRSRIVSDENGFDWETPAVRERRRFMDVMDEEIDDERKARINRYGVDAALPHTIRRLRHELGTRLDTYAEAEAFIEARQEGRLPFFREKPQITALVEGKDLDLVCFAVGEPKPTVLWFKNEAVVAESARIKIMTDADGRSHLKFRPALGFDLGMYKIVARNKIGQAVTRTRIVYGTIPDAPDSPQASQISDTEILLTWKPPKNDGNSQVLCYSLQYKLANESEWKKKAENIDHEFYLISGLMPNINYMFRLAAYNVVGWSEQGVSTGAVCTAAAGATKIILNVAMKHLQQITDSGDEVLQEPPEHPDYNLENKPIEWTEGDAQDQYEFISEISRGKFSAVLKAIDKKSNKLVVVKLIDLNAETTEGIDGEFAALRSLRHERVAGLLATYHRPDIAAFVLEKLQGADVLTYLASKHEYTEQTVSIIITQILDALQYLHWRNLCHLDLQPDNIVMCELRSVHIKLVDFGAAHRVTKLGTKVPVVGHLDYTSPEVLNEELAYPQSDIWSVGVLAYLMLSGRVPFQGEDDNETRQNITYVRYRFEYLYQELSQEGNRFIMNIFKRHPNKRPTAEECHENRWLLPTDSMIKKKERAIFLGNRLKEYSDMYHNQKDHSANLSKVGKSLVKSHSIQEELLIAP